MEYNKLRSEIRKIILEYFDSEDIGVTPHGDVDEEIADFGVFIYFSEGDEPASTYFKNKQIAMRYIKDLEASLYRYSGDDLPELIELWGRGADGSWGSTGRPLYHIEYNDDVF